MIRSFHKLGAALGLTCLLGMAPLAEAVPTLTLSDGVSPDIVITDNGAGDGFNLVPGAVLFAGTIGGYSITVVLGQTKPALGSATDPFMELGVDATRLTGFAGTSTVRISFSEDGFTTDPTEGIATLTGQINNFASPASVTYNTYIGASLLTSFTTTDAAFNDTRMSSIGAVGGSNFSLTQEFILSSDGPGSFSLDSSLQTVPDGGLTLALLGMSMVGLEGLRRRFLKS